MTIRAFQATRRQRPRHRRAPAFLGLLVVLGGLSLAVAPAAGAATTLFSDGFESGGFGAWSSVLTGGTGAAVVQSTDVKTGADAARLEATATSGSFAYARWTAPAGRSDLTVSEAINVLAEGASGSNVPFMRFLDPNGARVVSFYRNNQNLNRIYVNYGSTYALTSGTLPLNTWATVELSVAITSATTATITAKLNGATIYSTTTANLGNTSIKTFQIGNEVKAQAFTVAVDDVVVSAGGTTGGDTTPPNTTIDSGPSGTVSSTSATFAFSSSEAGSTFQCSLDNAAFAPCTSPASYTGLAQGGHTFGVKATDASGNTDPTPATAAWTISVTASCDTGAAQPSNSDPGSVVIADNFENGLSNWTKLTAQGDASVATQGQTFKNGRCGLLIHVTTNVWDSRANIVKTLPAGSSEIWATGWFDTLRQGTDQGWNVPTFRFLSDGKRVLDFSRQNVTGNLFLRYPNGSGGWSYIMAGKAMSLNRWYQIKVHAIANGNLSTVEVWVDGVKKVFTTSATLGVWQFDVAMVGAEHQNQDGDVAVDDVVIKTIVPPPSNHIFGDGFESGTLGAWSTVLVGADGTAAAQQAVVKSGQYAAQFTATTASGSFAYARQAFLAVQNDLLVTEDVRVAGEGAANGSVPLLNLYDAAGAKQISLYRINGTGALRIDHSGSSFPVTGTMALNTWANVKLHQVIRGAGAVDLVEVWINGALAYTTDTANLGTSGARTLQIGNNATGKAFSLIVDNVDVSVGTQGLGNDPQNKLLIADMLNKRLLITDFDGNVIWKFDNPTGSTDPADGPIGVRWMPGNRILATFGLGTVGLIDVATKAFVWRVKGFNGDWFQSPYDAEILPDGNLAVATRFNEGGRVTVYDMTTGAVLWKQLLSNAHSIHYRAQGYNANGPTLLIGGWGNVREVAYNPGPGGGKNVTWQVKTEFTHDAIVVENDRILTSEGYYIQKIDRAGTQIWKKNTPDEDRRIAVNPNVGGGYIYTVAEADRVEFRDVNGNLLRDWSMLSDGTGLDYPYGIQVIQYNG